MPRKPLPKGHKITVRFNDNELYEWLLKEAKETEREPDQQIRYFLRFIKGDIAVDDQDEDAEVGTVDSLLRDIEHDSDSNNESSKKGLTSPHLHGD